MEIYKINMPKEFGILYLNEDRFYAFTVLIPFGPKWTVAKITEHVKAMPYVLDEYGRRGHDAHFTMEKSTPHHKVLIIYVPKGHKFVRDKISFNGEVRIFSVTSPQRFCSHKPVMLGLVTVYFMCPACYQQYNRMKV